MFILDIIFTAEITIKTGSKITTEKSLKCSFIAMFKYPNKVKQNQKAKIVELHSAHNKFHFTLFKCEILEHNTIFDLTLNIFIIIIVKFF